MVLLCTVQEKNWLERHCDGRCVDGEWCIFADGTDHFKCPVDKGNFAYFKEDKAGNLTIET